MRNWVAVAVFGLVVAAGCTGRGDNAGGSGDAMGSDDPFPSDGGPPDAGLPGDGSSQHSETLFVYVHGSGDVSSNPAGIAACTAADVGGCALTVSTATTVTLTASADAVSVFAGWSGACSGSAAICAVVLSDEATQSGMTETVAATFVPATTSLAVLLDGDGSGTVTSTPAGIACTTGASTGCAAAPPQDTTVTLTAAPAANSIFIGWSGGCAGSASTCETTIAGLDRVTARFEPATEPLTIVATGQGTVAVAPGGLACGSGATCSENVPYGTTATVTATPATGWQLAGWGGACSGSSGCSVVVDEPATVDATFTATATPEMLTVQLIGSGAGNVAAPGYINCGNGGETCAATVPADTMITLTETPSATATFAGWAGPCHGTSPTCVVSLSAATTVTAQFNIAQVLLMVAAPTVYSYDTPGWGTVVGTLPDGTEVIHCVTDGPDDGTCLVFLPADSQITLHATPAEDASFNGWTSGPCSGSGACTFTLTSTTTVDALFSTFPLVTLTVDISSPFPEDAVYLPYIATCQGSAAPCSYLMQQGLSVSLESMADGALDSVFNEWGGACSGVTTSCTLTVNADETVSASFD